MRPAASREGAAQGRAGRPLISVRGLVRSFGSGDAEVTAVDGIDLDVYGQEFLAVTGRSGSGKTTLLNIMAGLDRPTAGSVLLDGLSLPELRESELVELRRRLIGFVFQSFGLMPLLSAQENVELPLHVGGVGWRERRRRAAEALDTVGLGPRARHRPYEMSGGEQQRVAIARALVTGPAVIFADEPTGELDSATAMSIIDILRDTASHRQVTVVVATHDLTLARVADRRLHLVDGRLDELGGGTAE